MGWFSELFRREASGDLREVWEKVRPRVVHLARPAIRLAATRERTSSWFGGAPVVDSEQFRWPESGGQPMAFLGQLDLAELAIAHRFEWLPDQGALAFFYDVEEMPWGFDPRDRGKWQVRYFESASVEVPAPPSMRESSVLERVNLRASKVEVLPAADSELLEGLELSAREWDAYCDYASGEDDGPLHQVGGFPSPVQGDIMELECQLVANGVYVGDATGYERPAGKKLAPGAKDWRLLLQFDSDDAVDVMWGDAGMIYFWIREQDARALRFDETWLILQCC